MKASVLECTLAAMQDRGAGQPDAATADLLQRMISVSDTMRPRRWSTRSAFGPAVSVSDAARGGAITIDPNGWGVTQTINRNLAAE